MEVLNRSPLGSCMQPHRRIMGSHSSLHALGADQYCRMGEGL